MNPRRRLAQLRAVVPRPWLGMRTLLNIAVIALGTALGCAVHVINGTALEEFARAARLMSGTADLVLRSDRSGFGEALLARVAAWPEVAVASPVLEVRARLPGERTALDVAGIDPLRAARVQSALVPPGAGARWFDPDAIWLSPAALRLLGATPGGTIRLQAGLDGTPFTVAGVLPEGDSAAALGVMDIASAQWRFDHLGDLTRIDVRLRPGVSPAAVQQAHAAGLPPGVRLEQPADQVGRSAAASRAYRINLTVLALVALFTGAFLIVTSQALAVVRRRRQLALLRVLGLRRGELVALLLVEGLLMGVVGAALGIALGVALAEAVVRILGTDLGGGYFSHAAQVLHASPLALAGYFLTGSSLAALGALIPALEAGRAEPARALRAGDQDTALAGLRRGGTGLLLIAAGSLLAFAPPVAGIPLPGYGAILLWLLGAILVLPALAGAFFAHLRVSGVPGRVALDFLRGNPGAAALGAMTLVVSLALVSSMLVMVGSFRHSVSQWLDHMLSADLYLRAGGFGDTGFLDQATQARIAGLPGIAQADFMRLRQVSLDPARPTVTVIARPLDAAALARLPLIGERVPAAPGETGAWVSEAMHDLYGMRPGQRIVLPLAGKQAHFMVRGIWRDYVRQFGAVLIDRAEYIALTGDDRAGEAALTLVPGRGAAEMERTLRAILGRQDTLDIARPGEIRALSLDMFDRSFLVTYGLEAVALLIGVIGVGASLSAQVLGRRGELAMLRHIGMTRSGIVRMLAVEGCLVGLFGSVVGLVLGCAIGLVLIFVVNRQSFHWGMGFHAPWVALIGLTVAMVCAAGLAGWWSGRGATRGDPTDAVREDW